MPSKSCTECNKHKPIFSNGQCHECFAAIGLVNGLATELMPKRCEAADCGAYANKGPLCDRHYRRFLDHGTTDKVRTRSARLDHPEYKNWVYIRSVGVGPEWENFWTFVETVGERPSPRHWLERKDPAQPYGPENFIWRAPKLDIEHDASTREGRRAYQRALRAQTPRYWVGANLKRYFGMTREQYDELLAAQDGHCVFCDKAVDNFDDNERLLAVDHDHETGEVRGLLCRNHNVGLGHFFDDAAVLRAAADYLERPRHTGIFVPAVERKERGEQIASDGICSEIGCERAVKAKGLCATHYARFRRTGTAKLQGKQQKAETPTSPCSVDGCDKSAIARDLCQTHYMRWKRRGSPDIIFDTHGRPKVPPNTA